MTEPDCRTIVNKGQCEHLKPWKSQPLSNAEICTCKVLNVPVFPTFHKFGKIDQRLLHITPLFECPHMQQLRIQNQSPKFILQI